MPGCGINSEEGRAAAPAGAIRGQVAITLRAPQIDIQQLAEIDRFDLPDAIGVGRV